MNTFRYIYTFFMLLMAPLVFASGEITSLTNNGTGFVDYEAEVSGETPFDWAITDWGDGTDYGVQLNGSGDATIQASHQYADEGIYTVTLRTLEGEVLDTQRVVWGDFSEEELEAAEIYFCAPDDGRRNSCRAGDPVAIYTEETYNGDGTWAANLVQIYLITESGGILAVDAYDQPYWAPEKNTLLDSYTDPNTGQTVELWRLTSGEFQVNTTYANEPGKPFVVSWYMNSLGIRVISH